MAEASRTSGSDDLSHLLSTEEEKWKWKGNVDELRNFLTKTHSLTIIKDEEQSHQFKVRSSSAYIMFWPTTQTLSIRGNGSDELKKRLVEKSKGKRDITDETPDNISKETSEEEATSDSSTSEVTHLAKQGSTTEVEKKSKEDDINVRVDEKEILEAKKLALQFMSDNPSCIRAIPYEYKDGKSLTMCLYIDTNGKEIPKEIREAAKKMFTNCEDEFPDLPRPPSSKIVSPPPTSEKQKGLADITKS